MTSEPDPPNAPKRQASSAAGAPDPERLVARSTGAPTAAPAPGTQDINPGAVSALGLQFAAALIAFGYAGQWLDRRFNCAPVFLMIGVFFGGGGTFYLSYRKLMARSGPQR